MTSAAARSFSAPWNSPSAPVIFARRERLAPDQPLGQTELGADRAYLVLEQGDQALTGYCFRARKVFCVYY